MSLGKNELEQLKDEAFKIGFCGAHIYPTSHRTLSDSIVSECLAFYHFACNVRTKAESSEAETKRKLNAAQENFNLIKVDYNNQIKKMAGSKSKDEVQHLEFKLDSLTCKLDKLEAEIMSLEAEIALKELDPAFFMLDIIGAVYKRLTNVIRANSPIHCCVGLVGNCVGEIFTDNKLLEKHGIIGKENLLPRVVIDIPNY